MPSRISLCALTITSNFWDFIAILWKFQCEDFWLYNVFFTWIQNKRNEEFPGQLRRDRIYDGKFSITCVRVREQKQRPLSSWRGRYLDPLRNCRRPRQRRRIHSDRPTMFVSLTLSQTDPHRKHGAIWSIPLDSVSKLKIPKPRSLYPTRTLISDVMYHQIRNEMMANVNWIHAA